MTERSWHLQKFVRSFGRYLKWKKKEHKKKTRMRTTTYQFLLRHRNSREWEWRVDWRSRIHKQMFTLSRSSGLSLLMSLVAVTVLVLFFFFLSVFYLYLSLSLTWRTTGIYIPSPWLLNTSYWASIVLLIPHSFHHTAGCDCCTSFSPARPVS